MSEPPDWTRRLARDAHLRTPRPQRICELCVSMLSLSGGGISVIAAAGSRGVVCATDEVSAQIEDLQITLGEGPCVDASRHRAPVLVSDLRDPGDVLTSRWPAFVEGAITAGARAVFAFPLRIGVIDLGVLDLYRTVPGELTAPQVSAALMAADSAALAVLRLDPTPLSHNDGAALPHDVEQWPIYHPQVHQATGMVQVQLDVTTEDAFLILRARAFALGRPLSEVAHDVVARRLRFSKEET